MSTLITDHLSINNKGLFLNGKKDASTPIFNDINTGLLLLYKYLQISYPKFHKMDNLSKLAFIGVEILKKSSDLSKLNDKEVALVFQNSYSSLDTDIKHQRNINKQKPSPATFVYTLPNIMMGEIAIRNQWYGENLFVLTDSFELGKWQVLAEGLIKLNKAKVVVGGWVEVLDEHYELKLYFVS